MDGMKNIMKNLVAWKFMGSIKAFKYMVDIAVAESDWYMANTEFITIFAYTAVVLLFRLSGIYI